MRELHDTRRRRCADSDEQRGVTGQPVRDTFDDRHPFCDVEVRIFTRGAADTDSIHACLDDEIDDAIEGREIDTAVAAKRCRKRSGESIHDGHVMLSRLTKNTMAANRSIAAAR